MNNTVGIFHKSTDGTVWKSTGFKDSGKTIMAYQYKHELQDIDIEEFKTWTNLDLVEFPGCDNADKALPYDFDLHFDIKTRGALESMIENDWCDDPAFLEMLMEDCGLVYNAKAIRNLKEIT